MRTNIVTLLFVVLFLHVNFAQVILAQNDQTKQEKKAAKVKEKISKFGVGEKAKIKVELYNDTIYQGFLSEANADDFVIVDKSGNSHYVRYSDVNKVGGKNLSTGTKIAIGIGIGIGATLLTIFLLFISLAD